MQLSIAAHDMNVSVLLFTSEYNSENDSNIWYYCHCDVSWCIITTGVVGRKYGPLSANQQFVTQFYTNIWAFRWRKTILQQSSMFTMELLTYWMYNINVEISGLENPVELVSAISMLQCQGLDCVTHFPIYWHRLCCFTRNIQAIISSNQVNSLVPSLI